MRNTTFWWILIGLMILLDIYVYQAIKIIAHPASSKTKTIIFASYWTISIAALFLLLILPYLHFQHQARFVRTTIFAVIAGIFFAKLIASIFFLIDDIRRLIQWMAGKLFFS